MNDLTLTPLDSDISPPQKMDTATAIQLPPDIQVGTEPIGAANRAFVFGSKVIVPDTSTLAVQASNYLAVPKNHAYILGAAREYLYNRGTPFEIPSEIVDHPQLLSALDIVKCNGSQEAFLRIKMAGALPAKPSKPDVCDAVHLVKLQHNTLVNIKNTLNADNTYDKSDFSDGCIAAIENYFALLGDEVPMEKAAVAKIEEGAAWRINPIKKTVSNDVFSIVLETVHEGFSQSSEYVGLLKRQMTRGAVPVPKKRLREIAEDDIKTRLEEAETELAKYRKIFPHITEIPNTTGVLVVTSMARVTQTTIDGNIGFVMSDDAI